MSDRPNPLAADFADQIAAHQRARKVDSRRPDADSGSGGAAPSPPRPAPRPSRSSGRGRTTPAVGSVSPTDRGSPSGKRAQKDFLVPADLVAAVDTAGVRWADLIETAWWRHGQLVARGLERSATAGEVRVRPSLLVDVHAEIKAAAADRGWSASQLVTALVLRELTDRP